LQFSPQPTPSEEEIMQRKRGSVAIGITAALVLLGLTACSTPASSSSGTPKSNITLTVSRWSGPQSDAEVKLFNEYTKETGVKIRLDSIDYSNLQQKQVLNMSSKTGAYDLVYVPDQWMQQYTQAGYLTNLSSYLKNTKLTPKSFDLADISQSGQSVYSSNGSLYAMPYFVQTPLVVYQKAALTKAGLTVPKTWSQMLKVASTLKAEGTGIALPFGQTGGANTDIMSILLAGNKTDYFTKSGALDLNNPKVLQVVKFMKSLSKSGVAGSNGWAWDDVNKVLQFGSAPIGISTSGLFTALEDPTQSKVAGKLGYAPLPYSKQASGLIEAWGWGVPTDSKHKQAAYQLAEWLTAKAQLTTASVNDPSFISFRTSVSNDKALVKKAPWLPAVSAALAHGVTDPLQANAPQLQTALAAGLSAVVSNGKDPATMLSAVQSSLKSKF
jgi:multiple sugar transport system substrate-binding protein